jgi:hypothetical protein
VPVRTESSYAWMRLLGRYRDAESDSHLLHDACLSLGKGDVTARLVLDELDLDLPPLTAALLVIIIVIVACHGCPGSFGASRIDSIAGEIITRRRVVEGRGIGDVSHFDEV